MGREAKGLPALLFCARLQARERKKRVDLWLDQVPAEPPLRLAAVARCVTNNACARGAAVRSTTVVFCAIDNLISVTHKAPTAFPEFLEGLSNAGIPLVAFSGRGRLELDATIRKFGLAEPFIAEGGCGVYLPEDYFHLKPPRSVRLGRFTCIPQATPQPAAKQMLTELAEETEIEAVALRDLSPRELAQNTGLAHREAELLRQRDFDELFFFAGAAEDDVKRFREAAAQNQAQVRARGALWSLSVGANLGGCVRDLAQL